MKTGDYVLVLGCDCDAQNCIARANVGKVGRIARQLVYIKSARPEYSVRLSATEDCAVYEDSLQVIAPETAKVVYGVEIELEVQDEAR